MFSAFRLVIIFAFGWMLAQTARCSDSRPLFGEDFSKTITERWKPLPFDFDPPTDYRVIIENSNACLRGFARGDASALAVKLDLASSNATTFSWRWKISGCPTNGSDDKTKTFDHAGRVFVAFDTFIGPPYSINYVWANVAPTNATFNHPISSRSRFIVVESGNTRAGEWLAEKRDLQQDWQRLFGDKAMPKIVGIGVFTDSDGTKVPLTGWYDDIRLEGRSK